jgi:DNA-binding HxlR family transcriptional regulator
MSSDMPILPTAQIIERKREKTMLVLRFLRTTIYSTSEILGSVMGITTRSPIHRTLKSMERLNLIQSARNDNFGGKTLWGITAAGQRYCLQDGDEEIAKFFNPSKVSSSTFIHYLDIQRVHIALQKAGWKDFSYPDKLPRPHLKGGKLAPESKYLTRPDLLAINPDQVRGAIEMERFVKSERRYEEHIIPGHVRKLNAGEYSFVLWIARTPEQQETLQDVIKKAVQSLRERQKFHLEPRSTNYKIFQFNNLESLGS